MGIPHPHHGLVHRRGKDADLEPRPQRISPRSGIGDLPRGQKAEARAFMPDAGTGPWFQKAAGRSCSERADGICLTIDGMRGAGVGIHGRARHIGAAR